MRSSGHRINIGHWDVTYLVATSNPALDLQQRLDAMLHSEVAQTCAEHLASVAAETDSSVWFVRSLKLDFSAVADPSCPAKAAQSWGAQLAAIIHSRISRGDDEGLVLHFANRAAYLAQLARDLASGSASGKWYYEEFSPLFSQSPSRAIREALLAEPENIGPAMQRLLELRGLLQVLSKLDESDAQSLFDAWQGQLSPPQSNDAWVGRLLQVWSETPYRDSSLSRDEHPFRDGLWWASLTASRYAGADGALMGSVRSLLDLRAVLSALSIEAREVVIRNLSQGDLGAATITAFRANVPNPLPSLQFLMRHMGSDADWARQAMGVILCEQEYQRTPAARVMERGPAISSPHAGIFRLGPSLLACGGAHLTPAVRHLVSLKCLGRSRATAAVNDNAVRLFSGFNGDDLTKQLTDVQRISSSDPTRTCGPVWLLEQIAIPNSNRSAMFMRDIREDEWIWSSLLDENMTEDQATDQALLYARANGAKLVTRSSDFEKLAQEFNIPSRRVLQGVQPVTRDLDYFTTPEFLPELDLSATLRARNVLKHFARRLAGFDSSTADHLHQSFLAGSGFVRDTGERIEVELPSPPLGIVLSLAGIIQETYTLPWIEERAICLRQSAE